MKVKWRAVVAIERDGGRVAVAGDSEKPERTESGQILVDWNIVGNDVWDPLCYIVGGEIEIPEPRPPELTKTDIPARFSARATMNVDNANDIPLLVREDAVPAWICSCCGVEESRRAQHAPYCPHSKRSGGE